jgi:hypothetical protein
VVTEPFDFSRYATQHDEALDDDLSATQHDETHDDDLSALFARVEAYQRTLRTDLRAWRRAQRLALRDLLTLAAQPDADLDRASQLVHWLTQLAEWDRARWDDP